MIEALDSDATFGQRAFEGLTVVIPVRQSIDRPDAAVRLRHLLCYLRRACPSVQIVVSEQSLPLPVCGGLALYHGAAWVWHPTWVYSPAACKNAGAKAVRTDFLLFLDVDVLPTQHLWQALAKAMQVPPLQAMWFPVHFLSQTAPEHHILAASLDLHARDWTGDLDQVGFATGIHFFSRDFFRSLGGYDESFRGYGCEDIEMIHRCAMALGWLAPEEIDQDYLQDHRTKDRQQYRGFRKAFAEMLEARMPVDVPYCLHSWHPRRNKRLYRRMRLQNDKLLREKLSRTTIEHIPAVPTERLSHGVG